jgi:leucyl/phenylalanyl-tRNA--protein transferase
MDIRHITRNLTAAMVEEQYPRGLFPMADPRFGLVTWHRPARRAVIPLESFHVSRSLERTLRQARFEVSFNRDFDGVMAACADRGSCETWITPEFRSVYGDLHRAGKAHSVEVRLEGELAGGVYGVQLGGAFFAESKFHRVRDMSKVALAHLVFRLRQRGFALLEVQYVTPHLEQFGTVAIPHREYIRRLGEALKLECLFP